MKTEIKTMIKKKNQKKVLKNRSENFIMANEAIKMTKEIAGMYITRKTLITWLLKYNMGRKIGGRWVIYKTIFLKFLNEGSGSV